MNTILIIIGLLAVIILFVKAKELRHQYFYKGLAVLILLFLGSIAFVWITSGINISTYEGFLSLGKTYFGWLGSLANNLGNIGGYAVKHDWGVNSTIAP